ncbi:hypothetical protein C7974DRAFT_408060 [Boeremia exigua]|uniref:uncharacterized protein n=1 Tax=Boeremia exigua TaxID=749465 RepID=UPI001E8DB7DB|nr:uncharacterized protein C7974DRAFT_408060 [Boeremia exigua]KAH6644379.1 hypothetical protein C7974DRAFT_408060 [Boeremia exigua]
MRLNSKISSMLSGQLPSYCIKDTIQFTFDLVYLVEHQVDSGLSFRMFDIEYVFKGEESGATKDRLYWDHFEPSLKESQRLEVKAQRLLDQTDFSLVSAALSPTTPTAL